MMDAETNNIGIQKELIEKAQQKLNRRRQIETTPVEIFEGVPAFQWITSVLDDTDRGFRRRSTVSRAIEKVARYLLNILEKIVGRPLYIKLKPGEENFLRIEPRFLKIIEDLKTQSVIDSVWRCDSFPDLPIVPSYALRFAPLTAKNGRKISMRGSLSGGGSDSNEALASALAETLERYSLLNWDDAKMLHGSFDELKTERVLDPLTFKAFSDRQLQAPEMRKKHYFNHCTRFDWTEVESLLDGKKYYAPAQLIYIGYATVANEPVIRGATTSGAAAGDTKERAIYAALCENIERDAFLIFWLNKISPPRIDETTITDEYSRNLLSELRLHGIEITIFDITTDIEVPTFFALSRDSKGIAKGIRISAAARLDPEEAIRHLLTENIRGLAYMRQAMTHSKIQAARKAFPRLDIESRMLWWGDESMEEVKWLFLGPVRPLMSPRALPMAYSEKVQELKERFAKAGHAVYIGDATSALARKYGLHVIMSLVPDLMPMYLSEDMKYLGIKRLYSLPVQLGFLNKPGSETEMNMTPHPMD